MLLYRRELKLTRYIFLKILLGDLAMIILIFLTKLYVLLTIYYIYIPF